MSCSGNGNNAGNIITYIGIPLAVAGILPILYNFLATLATAHKVKGILRRSGLSPIAIRSDFFSRVIELELPRYKVATFDREDSQYWEPGRQLSTILGGTWTTLNWRTKHVATQIQRIQYVDQIKQPQAEVEFDELVPYLLDLGAIPDPRGWRVLRTNGVWTPKDQCLLSTPDSGNAVLTVAQLDDSDGHLSLKLNLSATWKRRSRGIPPRWIRLPSPSSPLFDQVISSKASKTLDVSEGHESPDDSSRIEDFSKTDVELSEKGKRSHATTTDCELSVDGLMQVATRTKSVRSESNIVEEHYHDIGHIRIRHGNATGVWFASALAAYASISHTISWYLVPDEISRFATKETVPCGVLVLLGILEDSEAPVWATANDDAGAGASRRLQAREEQHFAMMAEARMPPEQRQEATLERLRRQLQQRQRDDREKLQMEQKNLNARMQQAIQSTQWNNELVAKHSLRWLNSHRDSHMVGLSKLASVGAILHRMILDVKYAVSICKILDLWKSWSDHGGIKEADFAALKEAGETFAQATLLVDLIRDAAMAREGTMSADLHACIKAYKTVRLG